MMTDHDSSQQKLIGECLCSSVIFELTAPFREIISCYCSECRKTSGNFVSATAVPEDRIHFIEQSGLDWFTTDKGRRGFCRICGSSLLWKHQPENGMVSVMAGCLPVHTGLRVKAQIYVSDKSDFHEISSASPQYNQDLMAEAQSAPI
jgi:hypothetical protein